MFRSVGAAVLLVISSMAAFGCSSGLSPEAAKIRCDQEKTSKKEFVTFDAYNQCLACFEACGDTCVIAATAPASYTCPDGSASTTSSTSSTGTGG
jgi:hypothetical protein